MTVEFTADVTEGTAPLEVVFTATLVEEEEE